MAKAPKRWTTCVLYLLRKLTLRNKLRNPSSDHRLLLKSPVHTAPIPLLVALFPDAQFIYIHRNPYDVFRSAAHMADTTYWYSYLNQPSNAEIQEFYSATMRNTVDSVRIWSGRSLLRGDQLLEVSFDELVQKPLKTVQDIYRHFQWRGFDDGGERKLQAELGDVKSYQRNSHRPLSPKLKQIVQKRRGPSFDRLGYER